MMLHILERCKRQLPHAAVCMPIGRGLGTIPGKAQTHPGHTISLSISRYSPPPREPDSQNMAIPIARPLEIPRNVLEQIYRQAREVFPEECCGWLAGAPGGQGVSTVRACENVQNAGNHPIAPDRPAETAYVFKAEDLIELSRSFDTDSPARIIYHSHPNGMAYLSDVDRSVATSPWGGEPAFAVQQLVIGIDAEAVREAALYAWSEEEDGFVQIASFDGAEI